MTIHSQRQCLADEYLQIKCMYNDSCWMQILASVQKAERAQNEER